MTIRGLLEEQAARRGDQVAMKWRGPGGWEERTWTQHLSRVKSLAAGYGVMLKLKPREETAAIILGNCPQWIECYLALAGMGVSVVPMDPKLHGEETAYILNDSRAVVVTTDSAHLKMFAKLAPELKCLRAIVVVDGEVRMGQTIGDIVVYGFNDLIIPEGGYWYKQHEATEDDVASVIYTSGTTGRPKGAMLTHRNFVTDIAGALETFAAGTPEGRNFITSNDSLFVVLPLFHAFSFTTNFVLSHLVGCPMYFCESLRAISRDLNELKPTVFMSVPLLCEKMIEKLEEGIRASKIASFLMKIGLQAPVLHLVRRKLGGRLRVMITGGAPCPKQVLDMFHHLHIALFEGYGLTECAPVVSVTAYGSRKVGTIGKPCKGVEVRLTDCNKCGVGELQVRGPNVMKGYFHNDEGTREVFTPDGWLATGDLASIDHDGDISIRGRKKALIVNREGKNIYPEEVEKAIMKDPVLRDVVVVGYTRGGVTGEHVGAIVHPDLDILKREFGGETVEGAALQELVHRRCARRCTELADYKHVRKVVLWSEPLVRTSIGKVKRFVYKGKLDE